MKPGKFEASRWLVDCMGRTMRNFGADDARLWSPWVREAKHRQHLIAIAELVETRKLSSRMSKRMTTSSTRRCGRVETSTTAEAGGRNCGSCPDHFPEASLSTVQLFNCNVLIYSSCAMKMTNLDVKLTDDEMRETI